jgi:hypothetical protein
MARYEIAGTLETLGKHGADWPRATAQQWNREIDKAIADGLLVEDQTGLVRLPMEKPIVQKQLNLF